MYLCMYLPTFRIDICLANVKQNQVPYVVISGNNRKSGVVLWDWSVSIMRSNPTGEKVPSTKFHICTGMKLRMHFSKKKLHTMVKINWETGHRTLSPDASVDKLEELVAKREQVVHPQHQLLLDLKLELLARLEKLRYECGQFFVLTNLSHLTPRCEFGTMSECRKTECQTAECRMPTQCQTTTQCRMPKK
jgi:hypothetical protein